MRDFTKRAEIADNEYDTGGDAEHEQTITRKDDVFFFFLLF